MSTWEQLEKELLSDPATKKEFDKLVPRYGIISELIAARIKHKMTQADVAKRIGTKQSSIARLESGTINPSFEFLQKVAQVLGLSVHLSK